LLEITASAQKELNRLDDPVFDRVDRKILRLAEDLRPHGCKKLKGIEIIGVSE
jgi:mRNA-degrading endonuclease RelE of RelBE toxin-antitoxin system